MWSAIITVGLQFIGRMLEKSKAKDGVMKVFYTLVKWFDKKGALKSVELSESYQEQLKKLSEKAKS